MSLFLFLDFYLSYVDVGTLLTQNNFFSFHESIVLLHLCVFLEILYSNLTKRFLSVLC